MATCIRQRDSGGLRQWFVIAFCSLLLGGCVATPPKAAFYQPLNDDGGWRSADWTSRLNALRNLQINRLYIQWTRHDAATFGGRQGWLWQLMAQASQQDFELVVGLYAEPAYFEHINTRFDPDYWADYVAKNLAWGKRMVTDIQVNPQFNVHAYFFPGELNDQILADPAALLQVSEDLAQLQRSLGKPLYVSVFYTGHLTPREYKLSLEALTRQGIEVLHQDGAGTPALNKNQVDELLTEMNCEFGIIHELFVQRSTEEFAPLNTNLMRAKVNQPDCARAVFFSWRYITPW